MWSCRNVSLLCTYTTGDAHVGDCATVAAPANHARPGAIRAALAANHELIIIYYVGGIIIYYVGGTALCASTRAIKPTVRFHRQRCCSSSLSSTCKCCSHNWCAGSTTPAHSPNPTRYPSPWHHPTSTTSSQSCKNVLECCPTCRASRPPHVASSKHPAPPGPCTKSLHNLNRYCYVATHHSANGACAQQVSWLQVAPTHGMMRHHLRQRPVPVRGACGACPHTHVSTRTGASCWWS